MCKLRAVCPYQIIHFHQKIILERNTPLYINYIYKYIYVTEMTEIFYFIYISASLAIVCLARPGALSCCTVVRGCLAHATSHTHTHTAVWLLLRAENCFVSALLPRGKRQITPAANKQLAFLQLQFLQIFLNSDDKSTARDYNENISLTIFFLSVT